VPNLWAALVPLGGSVPARGWASVYLLVVMRFMPDTWTVTDHLVLDAIIRWRDAHPHDPGPTYQVIAEEAGFDLYAVTLSVAHLEVRQFLAVQPDGFTGNWQIIALAPGARSAVGRPPTAQLYACRLMRAFEQAADEAPEGSRERSNLQAAAQSVSSLGRAVLVDIAAKVIGNTVAA
jgi:hypothetical protein